MFPCLPKYERKHLFLYYTNILTIFRFVQVFPLTINGGLSAGAKAKEAKLKKERKAENVLEKKAGKRSRVSIKDEVKNMNKNTNISDFYAGDIVLEGSGEEQGSAAVVDDETVPGTDVSTDVQTEKPQPFSLKSASRPGITSERIQNLFDPYVTGIAIRP